jgi:hypothetical protein
MSLHDSDLADAWTIDDYDGELLVLFRQPGVGGSIASMLSFGSVALVVLGKMSASLIGKVNILAEVSGNLVIVRPLEKDPESSFRSTFRPKLSGIMNRARPNLPETLPIVMAAQVQMHKRVVRL